MVHAISITDGKVSYRNRWVRTPKFEAESRAGRSVFDYILPDNPLFFCGLEPYRPTPESDGVSIGCPMTSVAEYGGRLLAFGEGDTTPMTLDLATLETKGYASFAPSLPASFGPKLDGVGYAGGHFRFCPITGDLFLFTLGLEPPFFTLHIISSSGSMRSVPFNDAPYAAYIHDFMITTDNVIVVFSPALMSRQRVVEGGNFFSWEPDRGTHVAVFPRSGGERDVVWIPLDTNLYGVHPINAFEAGGKIVYDIPEFPFAPLPAENANEKGMVGLTPSSTPLARWEIDVSRRAVTRTQLDDRTVELPKCDPRLQGLPYRYAYVASKDAACPTIIDYNLLLRYDLETGATQVYSSPPNASVSDPALALRDDATHECDGYLLDLIYRPEEDRSDLVILDAEHLDEEPVATAALPHRIPMPSHSLWVTAR
jgi:carotenoid cleavage dioxygenase